MTQKDKQGRQQKNQVESDINNMIPVSHPIFNKINAALDKTNDVIKAQLDRYIMPFRWGTKGLFAVSSVVIYLTQGVGFVIVSCFDLLVQGVAFVVNMITQGKYMQKANDEVRFQKRILGELDQQIMEDDIRKQFMDLGFGFIPIVIVAKAFFETLKQPLSREHALLSLLDKISIGLTACILIPLFSILHLVNQWVIQPPIIIVDYVLEAAHIVIGEILILPLSIMDACSAAWRWLYQSPKSGSTIPVKLPDVPSEHVCGDDNASSKVAEEEKVNPLAPIVSTVVIGSQLKQEEKPTTPVFDKPIGSDSIDRTLLVLNGV